MEDELKLAAQKSSSETQYEIRKLIIRMLKKGIKGKEIANQLGVSEGHVSNVKSAYEKEGIKGIKPKAMGRKKVKKESLPQNRKRKSRKS